MARFVDSVDARPGPHAPPNGAAAQFGDWLDPTPRRRTRRRQGGPVRSSPPPTSPAAPTSPPAPGRSWVSRARGTLRRLARACAPPTGHTMRPTTSSSRLRDRLRPGAGLDLLVASSGGAGSAASADLNVCAFRVSTGFVGTRSCPEEGPGQGRAGGHGRASGAGQAPRRLYPVTMGRAATILRALGLHAAGRLHQPGEMSVLQPLRPRGGHAVAADRRRQAPAPRL